MEIPVCALGRLARLRLTPEEEACFGHQLGKVLDYFAVLDGVIERSAVSQRGTVEVAGSDLAVMPVWRNDEAGGSLPREVALGLAPESNGEVVVIPQVVGES